MTQPEETAEEEHLIFAYGSLMNNASRRATLLGGHSATASPRKNTNCCLRRLFPDQIDILDEAVIAYLCPSYGYRRSFCYRAATGFTALGVLPLETILLHAPTDSMDAEKHTMCGVLFAVQSAAALAECDARERGYRRQAVPARYISIAGGKILNDDIRVWIYIPDDEHIALPSETHPVLQTYVDVAVRGCLEWGGTALAMNFLQTTHHWSQFWLNDAPMSRRPWLYRQDYAQIDKCLETCTSWVRFAERRHPEEYASRHLTVFRGMFGVPPRNHLFMGRDTLLQSLRERLVSSGSTGISCCELTGIGGVGKTQLSVEYCHRHFGEVYGLIVFVRAETAALLISDLRRIALDVGFLKSGSSGDSNSSSSSSSSSSSRSGSSGRSSRSHTVTNGSGDEVKFQRQESDIDDENTVGDDELIAIIKAKLARCRTRWLLVFDNVEDPEIIYTCLPRGLLAEEGGVNDTGGGHVIFTTRTATLVSQPQFRHTTLRVQCFDETDSLRYLELSLAQANEDPSPSTEGTSTDSSTAVIDESTSLRIIAQRMGHLPLALSIASAYLSRCDISCTEYLQRLDMAIAADSVLEGGGTRSGGGLGLGSGSGVSDSSPGHADLGYDLSIMSSLSVSIERIEKESEAAVIALMHLGYVSPDGISKRLVFELIKTAQFHANNDKDDSGSCDESSPSWWSRSVNSGIGVGVGVGVSVSGGVGVGVGTLHWASAVGVGPVVAALVSTVASLCAVHPRPGPANLSERVGLTVVAVLAGVGVGAIVREVAGSRASPVLPPWLPPPSRLMSDDAIENEVDRVWHVLQQFSLITVRGVRGDRIGSIHRLQQSVLRSRCLAQGADNVRRQLDRLVTVFEKMWTYKPTDPSTWEDRSTSLLLNHIQALKEHVAKTSLHVHATRRFSTLLTAAASYSQQVLSRFDIARDLLEAACNIRKGAEVMTTSAAREEHAQSLHMLGKVTRIQGHFDIAENHLISALDLRRGLSSGLIADTLHELGVLYMRMHDNDVALGFLSDSLARKKRMSRNDRSRLETSESATLYQLSVIRTSEGKLDAAQDLLLQVLALVEIDDDSGNVVSRAASLQQLGRVHMRKGQLDEAEARFSQALGLYLTAYGREKASRHMNVAAVRHQLGQCMVAMRRYLEAAEHFTCALQSREQMVSGGLEVIHEVQALAQVELELGRLDSAEAHFERQHALCNQMLIDHSGDVATWLLASDSTTAATPTPTPIPTPTATATATATATDTSTSTSTATTTSTQSMCVSTTPVPLPRMDDLAPGIVRKLDSVVRSLMFALNGLKGICKRKGDILRAGEFKARGRLISRRYECIRRLCLQQSDSPDESGKGLLQGLGAKVRVSARDLLGVEGKQCDERLISLLSDLRDKVRCAARLLSRSSKQSVDLVHQANALMANAERVKEYITSTRGVNGSDVTSEAARESGLVFVYDVLDRMGLARESERATQGRETTDQNEGRDVCERERKEDRDRRCVELAGALFEQCDGLRSSMRAAGVIIVDN